VLCATTASGGRRDFLWDAAVAARLGCREGELIEIPVVPPACAKEKVENGNVVFNTDCVENARKIASYEAEPVVFSGG
jgi:hypothetical protein